MSEGEHSDEGLGFIYQVWADGLLTSTSRTFSGAVQIADLYRSKGFHDVVIDAIRPDIINDEGGPT